MKKNLLTNLFLVLSLTAMSQVPYQFNYQAVIRNPDGSTANGSLVEVNFTIRDDPAGGNILFSESQQLEINNYGMFSARIGSVNTLDINWMEGPYFLEVTVDGITLSSSQLISVPYALMAAEVMNKDDADPDPTNEIQDLQLVDNVLSITGNTRATDIVLPTGGGSSWQLDGDSLTVQNRNVGIGTSSPAGKLVVRGDGSETENEALFEVKKADGQTVFAVYNYGAEVMLDENRQSGEKSGFSVGGYNSTLGTFSNNYLLVGPDSVRVYVDENPAAKAIKGGFAVGGYNRNKATGSNFMLLTPENYFIGHESGQLITNGVYNSTIGYQAGANLSSGSENIFLGYQSGLMNSSGDQNTFLGYQAGYSNSSGFQNLFIGFRTGYSNQTGQNNLFLGYEAGYSNTTGNFNVFMGYRAGALNTSGTSNLFIGEQAGRINTTGSSNLFIGNSTGFANEDGNRNLFIGSLAGYKNISGSSNLFFGEYAGYANTTGFYNIFIGTSTGSGNSTGSRNVFIGDQAGYTNSSGYNNSFVGYQSGYKVNDGIENTMVGFESGYSGNGTANVYLGAKAGRNNQGSYNIFIGSGAGASEIDISNTLVIDNNQGIAAQSALIYGYMDAPRQLRFNADVGISRAPLVNSLEVEGTASKTTAGEWIANSDRRIKTDILDLDDAYDILLQLHPVKFRYSEEYISDHPGIKDKYYYNFIAQEYREVFPDEVQYSGEVLPSGGDEILQMDSYSAQIYSIAAVKELIIENKKQKEQIEELYEMIRQLQDNK